MGSTRRVAETKPENEVTIVGLVGALVWGLGGTRVPWAAVGQGYPERACEDSYTHTHSQSVCRGMQSPGGAGGRAGKGRACGLGEGRAGCVQGPWQVRDAEVGHAEARSWR